MSLLNRNEELLLMQVGDISEKHDKRRIKNGGNFNIFHDEVKICRLLHYLLSPRG